MLLIVLTIVLILICLMEYKYANKELCSPALMYTAPFVVACTIAWLLRNEWYFELHLNTFLVIAGGCLSFFIGCLAGNKVKICRKSQGDFVGINDKSAEFWKYYLFILGEVFCYLWKVQCIQAYGRSHGTSTLATAIGYYNNALKFTSESLISYPIILSAGLKICTAAGFVWACILAQKLVKKSRVEKNLILVLINFAICLVGGMTSGGRGGSIRLITAFICAYLIMYYKANNWSVKIPFKIIIKIAIIIVISIYAFIKVMDFIGRQEITMIAKYLANYMGAQIYNLDYYLNESFRKSEIWGEQTFQPIIQFFAGKLGIEEWTRYNLDLPSVFIQSATMGYISLGNVYTTFYAYIHDFGYVGVFILPAFSGFISQLIYKNIRHGGGKHVQSISTVIYSYLAYALIFSYFSNKFYELVFTPDMFENVIAIYIILFFLHRTRICIRRSKSAP